MQSAAPPMDWPLMATQLLTASKGPSLIGAAVLDSILPGQERRWPGPAVAVRVALLVLLVLLDHSDLSDFQEGGRLVEDSRDNLLIPGSYCEPRVTTSLLHAREDKRNEEGQIMTWLLRCRAAIVGVLAATLSAFVVATPSAADTHVVDMTMAGISTGYDSMRYPDGSALDTWWQMVGRASPPGVSDTSAEVSFGAGVYRQMYDSSGSVTAISTTVFTATNVKASKFDPLLKTLSFTGQGTWTKDVQNATDDSWEHFRGDGSFAVTYTGTEPRTATHSATIYDPGSVTQIVMNDVTQRGGTFTGSVMGEQFSSNDTANTILYIGRYACVCPIPANK